MILALTIMVTMGISAAAFAHSGGTDKTDVIMIVKTADITAIKTFRPYYQFSVRGLNPWRDAAMCLAFFISAKSGFQSESAGHHA